MGTINWPQESGTYKVVQLDVDNEPYLFFGPENELHSNILADALDSLSVPYHKIEIKPFIEIPEKEGNRYRACGMGRAQIYADKRKAIFGTNSYDYKIGIDPQHLERIGRLQPEWSLEIRS